jgi:hypothetical protein
LKYSIASVCVGFVIVTVSLEVSIPKPVSKTNSLPTPNSDIDGGAFMKVIFKIFVEGNV